MEFEGRQQAPATDELPSTSQRGPLESDVRSSGQGWFWSCIVFVARACSDLRSVCDGSVYIVSKEVEVASVLCTTLVDIVFITSACRQVDILFIISACRHKELEPLALIAHSFKRYRLQPCKPFY